MFFIKSSKLLVLVTTLCVMVTNSSKASNAIEVLDSNNIEHSSNIVERNMESVVIGDNNINESHNNNEVNNNHNNLEYSNNNINRENINNEHNNSHSVNENADQNNNNYVILEVKEEGIQVGNNKEENLYNAVKNTLISIVLIPTAAYNNIVSHLVHIANSNIPSIETTMNELNNVSKSMINISFDNTTNSIAELIKVFGSQVINIGINVFGGIKGYIVRKVFG